MSVQAPFNFIPISTIQSSDADIVGFNRNQLCRVQPANTGLPPSRHRQPCGYWMVPRDNLFRYREVTLIIDVWQSLTKKLIWRGWVVAAIEVVFDGQKDPEVVIRSAVAKILDALPAHVSQRDTAMSVSVSGYIQKGNP
ncbi:MAG: hypothetical protein BGO21_24570 [Dyadobacter sp. 50-39]|nr:MAG: hypothetical protein BGO21_24570 [Dyadobacter sp. 50-39]